MGNTPIKNVIPWENGKACTLISLQCRNLFFTINSLHNLNKIVLIIFPMGKSVKFLMEINLKNNVGRNFIFYNDYNSN